MLKPLVHREVFWMSTASLPLVARFSRSVAGSPVWSRPNLRASIRKQTPAEIRIGIGRAPM